MIKKFSIFSGILPSKLNTHFSFDFIAFFLNEFGLSWFFQYLHILDCRYNSIIMWRFQSVHLDEFNKLKLIFTFLYFQTIKCLKRERKRVNRWRDWKNANDFWANLLWHLIFNGVLRFLQILAVFVAKLKQLKKLLKWTW